MKIQHKITLVSSSLFGIIFLLAAVVIYVSFYNSSKHIFYKELARTAEIAGMFYLEKDELSKRQYRPIEKAFYNLSPNQEISIYDEQDQIAFDTQSQDHDYAVKLDKIRTQGTLNFKEDNHFYHGLFYKDNQGDFVVLVKAENPLLESQLKNLFIILLISFLVGMGILVLLTSWLSKLAYKPVRHTIHQVKTLDLNQNPLELSYKPTKDELEELVEAFNGLLKEIEQTYQQQKNFIDYASHELKTPMAGIISQLEVTLNRQRSSDEYKDTLEIVYQEAQRLQDILKNLLVFSGMNRTVHQKSRLRIDELLWTVIEKLSRRYPKTKFHVDLQIPSEKYNLLSFNGHETLLHMAFFNLIENAAKFSDYQPVSLILSLKENHLHLHVKDRGIGMDPKSLTRISQPFYRAENARQFKGSGLGISIALKILELHHIQFSIESEENQGTEILLIFPLS